MWQWLLARARIKEVQMDLDIHKADYTTFKTNTNNNISALQTDKLGKTETAVNSLKWNGYEIQVNGTDGIGIINFKTA